VLHLKDAQSGTEVDQQKSRHEAGLKKALRRREGSGARLPL